jgi:hypothetical protein
MPRYGRSSEKWNSLTPAYKQRLSRAGITRQTYLSGAPLKQARGHARTPENRAEVRRHPERFSGYIDQLESLRGRVIQNLRTEIGLGFAGGFVDKFDILTITQHVTVAPRDVLLLMVDADLTEIQEQASSRDNEHIYFIDGVLQRRNLWWYH